MDTLDVLTHHARPIPPTAVRRLYDLLGWWPHRSAADIAQALTAGPAVAAWDGPTLVGLARALTDGPLRAYVEDVAVLPAYRRHSLGTHLLTRLLAELAPVETVSLFCDPDLAPFYLPHGFRPTTQLVMHRPRPSLNTPHD